MKIIFVLDLIVMRAPVVQSQSRARDIETYKRKYANVDKK
jgi:hypothetical protein